MSDTEIRRTTDNVERDALRIIKRIAFAISAELVRATPVDTGWARANWLISVGSPINKPAGSRGAVDAGAQAAGQARLLVYRTNQGTIWISNNVPYIQVLNAGRSRQAPANFVENAILAGIAQIR